MKNSVTHADSPHVLLTRAADALEECASKASPGPWEAGGGPYDWLIRWQSTGDAVAYDIENVADADWINSLSPAVGLHPEEGL